MYLCKFHNKIHLEHDVNVYGSSFENSPVSTLVSFIIIVDALHTHTQTKQKRSHPTVWCVCVTWKLCSSMDATPTPFYLLYRASALCWGWAICANFRRAFTHWSFFHHLICTQKALPSHAFYMKINIANIRDTKTKKKKKKENENKSLAWNFQHACMCVCVFIVQL